MTRLSSIGLVLIAALTLASCEKNTTSKIPQISLIAFLPDTMMRVNVDTAFIEFSLVDGDADIGDDTASGIFLKDSRFESLGFLRTDFPYIDPGTEDPNKGMQGTVLFIPVPQPVPRSDSVHFNTGDTLTYEMYVTDRAGHTSNHITTHAMIIRP